MNFYIYNPIKGFSKEMTVWRRGKGGSEAADWAGAALIRDATGDAHQSC